jgi:hypothetical protein
MPRCSITLNLYISDVCYAPLVDYYAALGIFDLYTLVKKENEVLMCESKIPTVKILITIVLHFFVDPYKIDISYALSELI